MVQDEARQIAQYWDKIANDFDSIYTGKKNPASRALDRWLRRDMYERFDWVMRQAESQPGQTICDVGCGSGRFVNALARKGATVTGLDFAPAMLDLARELVRQEGTAERCDFVLSDVLDWKTDRKFDLVIAIGFWDYVAEPLDRLKVIRSITKDRFLSAWPRAGTLRASVRAVRLKLAGCPVYFWTRQEVDELLKRAGFQVESCEIHGQLFCIESKAIG
jgi:cyclopropane fatty-acyl-phospholipid synthase-like methyltransferase